MNCGGSRGSVFAVVSGFSRTGDVRLKADAAEAALPRARVNRCVTRNALRNGGTRMPGGRVISV